MNICFYTDYTISGMTGGIGRVTTVLTDYFRQNFGWKVYSIFAFDASQECVLTATDGAIRLRLHDRLGIRKAIKSNYPLAARFIAENKIDIVVVQTSMDVVAKLRKALDAALLSHVKIVSVLHYTPGTDEFPIDASKFWKGLAKGKFSAKDMAKSLIAPLYNHWEHRATVNAYQKAYEKGDAVIVLSKSYIAMYKAFANLSDTTRLTAIPNCVPFECTASKQDIDNKQKTCLMVGRMVEYPKRVMLMLKMWQQIEQTPAANDWSLEIVGDGPDLQAFQAQAQSLHLQRCFFRGRQNPIDYYRKASLFLMTSAFEGFPMTLVEAQQMGCVPVAFDSFGSLHEVVTDDINGCIVKEGAIKEYVDKTLALIQNDTKRQQLATNSVNQSAQYSQKNICESWQKFFTSILS